MINNSIREKIAVINPDALLFDNPSFDYSIIGVTFDGRAIYEYDRMINELASEDGSTWFDAQEFIDYNTIRANSYMSDKNKPYIAGHLWYQEMIEMEDEDDE